MSHPQQKTIDGLRELADWLEAHADAPQIDSQSIHVCLTTQEAFASANQLLGNPEPVFDGDFMILVRQFGAIKLRVFGRPANVCERTQVGEKTVPVYEWRVPELANA